MTSREARPDRPEDELRRDLKVMREILADYPPHDLQVTLDGQDLSGTYIALHAMNVGSSRVDLQACKLEYSIVSPK